MLQQILQDMCIDPDLLTELSDDQQQMLYFKMREEQIRRYDVWSAAEDKKPNAFTRTGGSKKLQWQTDHRGDVWVWVMGYHGNDKPYEQLLEEARIGDAKKKAEEEMRAQRELLESRERQLQQEEELKQKKLQEEEQRLALVMKAIDAKRKRSEEAAMYASLKEAKLAKLQAEKLEQERRDTEGKEKELKERERTLQAERLRRAKENQKRKSDYQRQVTEKSENLYMTVSQVAVDSVKMAEKEREKVEKTWQVTLRKIKLADKEKAMIARRAREEVRNSRISRDMEMDALTLEDMLKKSAKKETVEQSGKPKRPQSKKDVIRWYKSTEIPKMAGIVKSSKKPEKWFHGCIGRQQVSNLLDNKDQGSFLIRLSEKVWGYALSYKDTDKVKHFLIDASGTGYQFFGTDQFSHKSLSDMVNYHKERPITFTGQEILKESCGQNPGIADYQDLF